jgi:hypothetical protein
VPTLYRFDDDGGQILGVVANPLQRLRGSILQHDHVLDRGAGNARCHRHGARCCAGTLHALDQHLIELAVIIAVEYDDLLPAGHGARDAHGRHDGFRARIAKGHAFVARHFAEQVGDFACEVGLRTDGEAAFELCLDRLHHEGR